MAPVFSGGGSGLTSHELEGLGLEDLIGVGFRNSTHICDVQLLEKQHRGRIGVEWKQRRGESEPGRATLGD
jgi:hypothetical protein